MKRRWLIGLALLVSAATDGANARVGGPSPAAAAIRKLLAQSAANWSAGDLDSFMRLYEQGPETAYVGSDGIVYGADKIRDRYRTGFGTGAHDMGTLSIDPDTIRLLGRDFALVTGHYKMERPAGSGRVRGGVFTLVLHRSTRGWGVISDHSS